MAFSCLFLCMFVLYTCVSGMNIIKRYVMKINLPSSDNSHTNSQLAMLYI